MTWQLASFVLLGLGLAAGFAWYERSQPSARVLSLVAALAALAVVGRLAFAAFPNVKPTTDIVLLSGYVLGGAPGFAVGAITALASNIFLGHGPWTPWQMAAWGGVGIAGAGLARAARGRELGRWTLAAACGVAGAGFGLVMDTYQWTLAAQQDLATWIAVSGSSLPYNLAHVFGNVAFCLLVGPAFLRALTRYRRRFDVRWAPAAAAAGAVLLLAFAPAASAASAGERGARWLVRAQNGDGGFGSAPRQSSSALFTGWAALGLAASGRNPADVARGGPSALEHIRRRVRGIRDVGELERTILVVRAAGLSPRSFGGRDLVARLERHRRPDGSFRGYVSYTAFGILALKAARAGGTARPALWLARRQNADGGYGVAPRTQSDVDNTAAAVQALVAAGRRRSATVDRAVRYLRRTQNPDGGFGQGAGRSSNAQSTAYAVQGLVAAGRDPARFRQGGRSPLRYLRSLQRADGRVAYSRASAQTPVWVTAQAVMALERKPLPLAPVPRSRAAGGGGGAAGSPAAPVEPPPAGASASTPVKRDKRGSGPARDGDHETLGPPAPRTVAPPEPAPAAEGSAAPAARTSPPTPTSPAGADWLGAVAALAAALLALWAGAGWRRRRIPGATAASDAVARLVSLRGGVSPRRWPRRAPRRARS